MATKHVKSEREERIIFDIYQLDPSFYKKIISRSSSLRFGHQNSLKRCCGEVPFIWEIQPGKPRDVSNVENVQPIRFPPAIYSLSMPRPSIAPTGPKACLLKNLKKVKKIGPPLPIHMPKPNFVLMKNAKVYFSKHMKKKVEKIKNIWLGKKMKGREKVSDRDGYEFSYFDFDDFAPSPSTHSSSSFNSPKLR